MLILVLDMAIRSAFSKDAISKLEDFVLTRDNVQRIIIDLFQHPAEYLHLRRARAIFVIPPEANSQFFPPNLSISFVTYTTTFSWEMLDALGEKRMKQDTPDQQHCEV